MKTICICGGGALGLVVASVLSNTRQLAVHMLTAHPQKWSHTIEAKDQEGKIYQGTLGNDNGQGYSNGQGSTESNNQNGNGNSNVGTINLYGEGSSNSTNVQGSGNAISNSSSSSPSADLSTSPLTGGQSSASSESSSVSKKAYEIDELTEKENFIPSVIYVIITMFLILCGYRRKSKIMND